MKRLKSFAAAALMLLVASTASAAPILVTGSTYDLFIRGEISLNGSDRTATVDGVAEAYTRAGLNLSLNETDTDLGSGNHLISVRLNVNGDLYPSPGEGAEVGLGSLGNALNLLTPVHLTDARLSFFNGAGAQLYMSGNLADDYRIPYFSDPWSGFFPEFNGDFLVGGAGGRGIQGVQLDFTVAELTAVPVPEPATLTLLGVGLSGIALRRRRSRT